MVPSALLYEQTETAKSASPSNDEGTRKEDEAVPGDELAPSNALDDELTDQVVHLEELHGAPDGPVELPVPQVEHKTMEPRLFAEVCEDECFAVGETGHCSESVTRSEAPDDGLTIAQEPEEFCLPTSWTTMCRGAPTWCPTVEELQNSGEPLFLLGPDIDLGESLWPKVLNYSPSQLEGGFRPRKKRRLSRFARDVRRKRMKRRASRTDEEEDSGCEADTEWSEEDEWEEDDSDDDNDNGNDNEEEMASLGLWCLALASTC
ncbi:uncharacterized protein [Dermacentor albipictus]|uniref:uncharacterized protein n=1 Tax=Dermacentor albipictus TaxID=60249 RepID=UPI0031FCF852